MPIRPAAPDAAEPSSEQAEHSTELLRADAPLPARPASAPVVIHDRLLAAGRFRLIRLLGRGATGVVYEAFDAERAEPIALKMLVHCDASGIYQLKHEFRALADVRHPNLAKLFELLNYEDSWFLTMECVDGEPFDAWVRPNGVCDEARLRTALLQLASAVRALHAGGKLHRDLKPSNVLVTPAGRVVVLDFGLALDSRSSIGQTVSGEIGGTPAYMAPEHALGMPADESSDLYAIGVLLYQSLSGKLPFAGTIEQIFFAKRQPVRWPDALADGSAQDLVRLSEMLLSIQPAQRPSIDALIDSLSKRPHIAKQQAATPSPEARQSVVGRSVERAELASAFEHCLAERASLVAVRGTSGIGKTALCSTFLDDVQERARALVLRSRCYEHENLPFKALDPLIDALGRHHRRSVPSDAGALLPREVYALTRLFPSLARIEQIANMPDKPIADPHELRRRAFRALMEWLARLRDRQPVVVFIDDLQWACADSLQALHQLLAERNPAPVLIVIAYRDDATYAEASVQSVIETARGNPGWHVRELPLRPLSESDSGSLAQSLFVAAQQKPDSEMMRAITAEAAGNPLLIRELARFASRGGSLSAVSLSSVVAALCEELTPQGRDLIETVALIGEPLDLEVALAATGARLLDVDQLRSARLLRTGVDHDRIGQTQVECYHDRIREVLTIAVAAQAAREHFTRFVRVVQQHAAPDHQLLCRCLERAGRPAESAEHALHAAREAERTMAFERAARLYQKCLELGQHSPTERRELRVLLGTAQENAGHGSAAAETFLNVAAELEGASAIDLRRRAAEQWLATGHAGRGAQLLRSVCRELDIDLPESAQGTLITLSWKHLQQKRIRLEVSDRGASHVSARNEQRMRAARTAVLGLMGYHPLQCRCVAADYLLMAFDFGGVPDRVRASGFYAYLLSQADPSSTRAAQLLRHMNQLANNAGSSELLGFAAMIMGAHLLFAGKPEARVHFERARTLLGACHGVHWELDAVSFHDLYSAFDCGDFADIARRAPGLIEDALRRDRHYTAAMLTGFGGVTAWTVPNEIDACRRQLREQRLVWQDRDSGSWPDLMLLLGEAMLELYAGRPEVGRALLEGDQRRFQSSLLTIRATGLRSHRGYWRMCLASALSAARTAGHGSRRVELAKALRRDLGATKRRSTPRGRSEALRAALAADADRADEVISRLRSASELWSAGGKRMHAAAAQRRLDQWLNPRVSSAADAVMLAEGVKDIEAMTEFLCPGCRPDA